MRTLHVWGTVIQVASLEAWAMGKTPDVVRCVYMIIYTYVTCISIYRYHIHYTHVTHLG